ncbi:MAG: endonuclease III [Gemmatimonadota bacterium]
MSETKRKTRKTEAGRRWVGETKAERKERVTEIIRRLWEAYPDATTSLRHETPYELLVATILSAQCTDERVNMVTPELFARYPGPEELAGAKPEDVEEIIRSTGFFRQKTRSLLGMAEAVVEQHDGEVPGTMNALVKLPGVGRKTANVVLGNAFGKDEGVVVDTHVKRLSGRLGLTAHTAPDRIERDLMELVPEVSWTDLPHLFIFHGRAVCKAPTPLCDDCVLADLCPSAGLA